MLHLKDCKDAFKNVAIRQGAKYTLPTCEPTLKDHTFAGWKDADGAAYKAGAPIEMSSDITLTAQWEPATKEITLNFYDEVNNTQVKEEKMTVAKDATTVGTAAITEYLPEGYEFTMTGDLMITTDGYVYVGVKPATKEITLNFYDEVNNTQVKEEKMTVAKDATTVGTAAITEYLPEGYEFTMTGDLMITTDGYVYVGVKPATKEITLNFYDEVNNTQVKEEKMTVAKDATTVGTAAITEYLPEGYEFTMTVIL